MFDGFGRDAGPRADFWISEGLADELQTKLTQQSGQAIRARPGPNPATDCESPTLFHCDQPHLAARSESPSRKRDFSAGKNERHSNPNPDATFFAGEQVTIINPDNGDRVWIHGPGFEHESSGSTVDPRVLAAFGSAADPVYENVSTGEVLPKFSPPS